MYTFGEHSNAELVGVHPALVKVLNAAITDSPVDFSISEGVRTVRRQQQLYAQGRTTPGEIVTHDDGVVHKSNHQAKPDGYGHAVDLYPYVNGAIDYNDAPNRLKQISDHIKAVAHTQGVAITWGGDWTMAVQHIVDRPHFELTPGTI